MGDIDSILMKLVLKPMIAMPNDSRHHTSSQTQHMVIGVRVMTFEYRPGVISSWPWPSCSVPGATGRERVDRRSEGSRCCVLVMLRVPPSTRNESSVTRMHVIVIALGKATRTHWDPHVASYGYTILLYQGGWGIVVGTYDETLAWLDPHARQQGT